MTRRPSRLETAILVFALENHRAGTQPERRFDITVPELHQKYFGIVFKPGFVKEGNRYVERSVPKDPVLSERYIRAEVAVWRAFSRLEDRGLMISYWNGLGSSLWCEGANLTEKGVEEAEKLPASPPTKIRWGRMGQSIAEESPDRPLTELEKTILRMAWSNRQARDGATEDDVDLLEWQILREHFGFQTPEEFGCTEEEPSSPNEPLALFYQAREEIFQACRFLDERGLIRMGGPGSPRAPNWGAFVRGWGLTPHEQAEVVRGLFPFGSCDTIALTPAGVLMAQRLSE